MEFSKAPGLALNLPGRNYLEASKFHRCQKHGWLATGFNFARNESYRCWSQAWFPVASILVCDCIMDVDMFIVNYEKTCDANAFDPNWLKDNEPKDDQLNLF